MKRRIFCIITTLALCLSLLPTTAWAEWTEYAPGNPEPETAAANEVVPAAQVDETGYEGRYRTKAAESDEWGEWINFEMLVDAPSESQYCSADYVQVEIFRDITTLDGIVLASKNGQHVELDGRGHTIKRDAGLREQLLTICGVQESAESAVPCAYVTLKNLILDGGAVWSDGSPTSTNLGATSNDMLTHLIDVHAGGNLTLGTGTVLRNNHITDPNKKGLYGGAVAVWGGGTDHGGRCQNLWEPDALRLGLCWGRRYLYHDRWHNHRQLRDYRRRCCIYQGNV